MAVIWSVENDSVIGQQKKMVVINQYRGGSDWPEKKSGSDWSEEEKEDGSDWSEEEEEDGSDWSVGSGSCD